MKPSELDPERWRRIDEVFEAALETPPPERAGFLAEACAADDELRAEVEALLDAHRRAETRFERPASMLGAALASAAEGLTENRRVGPFRLLREIGRGGMGVVYLAEDTRLGRHVALKALPPYLGVGREGKQRFMSEARAVSALDHPNIATLYEIGETDEGQLYMTFAFYEGETLAERIARGPLSVEESIEIVTAIAAGLEAAHGSGIVHRDVKPSNVLLTEGGEVKLLDFGVAKVAGEDATREGIRLGTVAYMSPEQAGGAPIDRRADLWSLGVVLYEMLDGERPFRAPDHVSLLQSILHDDPEPPGARRPKLPEAVERVVDKLLCKAPDDRYASAEELLIDLRAVGDGKVPSVTVRDARRPKGTGRIASRGSPGPGRRRIRASAAVLGMAAVAGGVWLGSDAASTAGRGIERVAVLPPANLTGDPEQQYFVDGIHSALIAELGRTGVLDVLSRTSVMRYRDAEMSVPEIARELGVDAVVEGSVFREGDSLAITAQLVAASPERHLWANRYRRSVEDVFEIVGDVTRSIGAAIDVDMSLEQETRLTAPRRVNPRTYDAYLRGRVHRERRNREGFDLARSFFRRAIEIDSTFAPAYAGLADTYSGAAKWGLAEPAESFPRARALAAKALRIDSTLPEAYAAMATVERNYGWNWVESERLSRRAVELNPSSARALRELGSALAKLGRRSEARALLDRANELDTDVSEMGMAFVSYTRRDFDRTIEHARSWQKFDAGLWQAPWLVCMSLSVKGLHGQAIGECEKVAARFGRRNPLLLAGLGHAYGLGGRRDQALRVVEELEELAGEVYVGPSLRAIVYGALGDRDRAFEWLDRAYEERDALLMKLRAPFFDPLRSDPRFDVLLEKIGLERR